MKLNKQKKLVLTQKEYDEILTLTFLDCNGIDCKVCPFIEKDGTCLINRLTHIANQATMEE